MSSRNPRAAAPTWSTGSPSRNRPPALPIDYLPLGGEGGKCEIGATLSPDGVSAKGRNPPDRESREGERSDGDGAPARPLSAGHSAAVLAGTAASSSTASAAAATRVPVKKRGFWRPNSRTTLAKVKSRKSAEVASPSSTIGLGHDLGHVRHVEMADVRAEDRIEPGAQWIGARIEGPDVRRVVGLAASGW